MESPSLGDPNEGAAEGRDAPQSAVPMLGGEPVSPARPLKHATALFVNGPYTFALWPLQQRRRQQQQQQQQQHRQQQHRQQ